MNRPDDPDRGGLAALLRDAATDLAGAPGSQLPAAVVLAQARRAFTIAGLVSSLLDEYAVPARDAYPVAESLCRAANSHLDHALGRHLVKRYGEGTRAADVPQLQADAQIELWNSNDTDIEKITKQMITLASTLEKVLGFVADDETAPPGLRELARTLRPNAEQVWAHYGGDSGGW